MSLSAAIFVAAQQLYHEGFGFHPGGLSCGVESTFFSQAVVPVAPSLEQQERPLHGASRFTLFSQVSVKPGVKKRPWSCKSPYGRYL
jgi:hypothetical protein